MKANRNEANRPEANRSERAILADILLAIGNRQDLRVWRNNSGALKDAQGHLIRFGLPGSADILGILKPTGRFLAIECKTEIGKQSDLQKAFQRMIESHGGLYILARSVGDVLSNLPGGAA